MNKVEDIINCYKKIPINKFILLSGELQPLLDEKLLFYTKIIENTCDFMFKRPTGHKITISQKIEIEEDGFKKRTIQISGTKEFDESKSFFFDGNTCVESWEVIS